MTDQNHARSGMNVPVIRNVQQQFFQTLLLNPAVKHRNQRLEVHFLPGS